MAGCTGDDGADGGMDNETDGGMGDNETTADDETTADETTTDGQADVRGGLPSEPSDGAEVAMVTEEDQYYFEPEVTWVTPGSTVTWINESGSHSSTAYAEANDRPQRIPDDAEAWDSGTLTEEGAEFEHTFEVEGVYDYFCLPHESLGMLGTVIVGEPDPEGQNGLAEPQEDFDQEVADHLRTLNDAARSVLEDGGQ